MTEPAGLAITLAHDSIVNERTGNVSGPSEYVENLRALERTITRADEDIGTLRAQLKMAREAREEAVAALRSAIREGKVLPLLEVDGEADTDGTGDQPNGTADKSTDGTRSDTPGGSPGPA